MGKKFGKVIAGVALIVIGYFTGGSTTSKGIALLGKVLIAAGINTLIDVAITSLVKTRRAGTPPVNITLRGTVEFRRIVFGTRRCGGVLVFYGTSGTENKFLWYVIAYAGHQSSAFSDFWIDERRIASADIPSGGGGTVTASPWNSKLVIYKHLGSGAQTVDTNLDSAFTTWTSNHKLLGTTYAVIRFERDTDVFPDVPGSVSAKIDGLLLYDPRLDSTNGGSGSHRMSNPSTWAFSHNPALMVRWYMTGGSVDNNTGSRLIKYGCGEIDSRIDDAYVIAAANICDEVISGANEPPSGEQPRYCCDLEVHCGESHRDILTAILATFAGTLTYVHGKWRTYAGAYDSPIHTLTDADLYGELEVQDTVGHDSRYNAVAPIYFDAASQYVQTTGGYRTDSGYETQDGGERIPTEIQLDGVTDVYQAQRLAEIHLRKSRMMCSVKFVGALNLLKVAQHETLQFTHARYDPVVWTNRVFRAKERQLDFTEEAGRVTLLAQLEDPGVWTDLLTADYTTGTSNTDIFEDDGLRLSLGSTVDTDEFDAVSVTAVFPFPDNSIGGHTTLASITYNPAVDTPILLSATFTIDYTTGTTGVVQFIHSIQGASYDVAFRQEVYENIGSAGVQRKRSISIFRQFIATGGVSVTYKLIGSHYEASDTVVANTGQLILQARS